MFDAGEPDGAGPGTSVVVIGAEPETYGVAVDRFLGERMLVVQPLDARLQKIRNIAAGALLENGDPVLIVDVEDLVRSVDKLVRGGQLTKIRRDAGGALAQRRKQVLVVDDSLTVRELERKLLEKRGYAVTVAVDGMDGWNALRGERFDLVVTDIDMPRMDGIELVTLIKGDPLLKARAGDDRLVQGSRRGSAARPGCRRRLLPGQGQLPRRGPARRRARPDRGGQRMNIGIVNDLPLAVEALRRAVSHDGPSTVCCGWPPTASRRWISAPPTRPTWC